MRALLLTLAGFLLLTAVVLMDAVQGPHPYTTNLKKGGKPFAAMNHPNVLGDKEFWCLSPGCDPFGGFRGKSSGLHYSSTHDAILGVPNSG